MAVPAFVGVGSWVSHATDRWPSSLTVTTAALPAGSVKGDRLLLSVPFGVRRFSGDPTFFHKLTTSNATWIRVGQGRRDTGGGGTMLSVGVEVWTARNTPAAFPATFTPIDMSGMPYAPIAGTPADHYLAINVAGWRPSAAVALGNVNDTGGTAPLPDGPTGSGTFANDGTAVAIGSVNAALGVDTLNGFTSRSLLPVPWQPYYSLGNGFGIGDKPVTAGGTTNSMTWWHTVGATGGMAIIRLDTPDPPIRAGGWSVGFIKW